MNKSTQVWLHGLLAALIGGGASAVSGGIANVVVDPKDFNVSGGLIHLMEVAGTAFVVGAFISVAAYLKQSPVPPEGQ